MRCRAHRHLAAWLALLLGGLGTGLCTDRPASAAEAGAGDGLYWLQVSAQQGNPLAQETLAAKRYFGDGLPKDYREAAQWVGRAIDGGAARAKSIFAGVSPGGSREPTDIEALRWLQLGAEKEVLKAQEELGVRLSRGDGLPRDPAAAARWLESAAQGGSARSQYYLSRLYREGQGVSRDAAQALTWLRSSAEQGYPEACLQLGTLYSLGVAVPSDDRAAAAWLRRAAGTGMAAASSHLWHLQQQARVSPVNDREAREWLEAAAEAGDPRAERLYGDAWSARDGVPSHLTAFGAQRMAAFWYRRAALRGDAQAQLALARMSLEGRGMVADPAAAYAWASLARAAGHPEAAETLRLSGETLGEGGLQRARKKAEALRSWAAPRPSEAVSSQ
jgi:TPR repeat protein